MTMGKSPSRNINPSPIANDANRGTKHPRSHCASCMLLAVGRSRTHVNGPHTKIGATTASSTSVAAVRDSVIHGRERNNARRANPGGVSHLSMQSDSATASVVVVLVLPGGAAALLLLCVPEIHEIQGRLPKICHS